MQEKVEDAATSLGFDPSLLDLPLGLSSFDDQFEISDPPTYSAFSTTHNKRSQA